MVVFAGTFDPITKGHESVINKCVKKHGSCLVVVGENPAKEPLFSEDERVLFIEKTFSDNPSVKVIKYSEYKDNYADFLAKNGIRTYARGIRNRQDLKYEKKYAKKNKKIYPTIKTKYIKIKKYKDISSSLVKDLLVSSGDLENYLPEKSIDLIKKTYQKRLEK